MDINETGVISEQRMPITVTEYIVRTVVVTAHQRLDAFSAPTMRARLEELIESGAMRFVVDLSDVPFLDSAGMAVLVSLLKRVRQNKGDVRLIWPREEGARRILRLTKFDRVFTIADSVEVALNDF